MKKKNLFCGIILMGLMGIPTVSNAQAPRVAREVVRSIGKTASKNKKAVSNVTKQTTKNATKNSTRTEKTTHPISVSCSSCDGNGYILTWDSYTQQYVRKRCSRCNGTGKVWRTARY